MIPYYNGLFMFYPFLPPNCNLPPTIYSILESIVNPNVDLNEPAPEVKIKDLAKAGRQTIFNFDYPLTSNITKEKFETMILNHYLQRRIGFETVTAFRIQLDVKLNEIMPLYNKMFDALENWEIFNDGEVTTRTGTDNRTSQSTNNTSNQLTNHSTTSTNDISDRRNSELPQNQLEDLRNGSYVTNYNYDTNKNNGEDNSTSQGTSQATNQGTDNNEYNETITRTPADKIAILKEMQENIKSIYSLIYKELDCLFYSLV
ncbi:MAG: hypothetical protein [Bacteriophage sp.]|nr:MAG: hypothetical protein [Bacteriophage sp.]